MRKFLSVLAAAMALIGSGAAVAQNASPDPARLAAAKDLLDAMGGSAQVQGAINQLKDALAKDMGAREPTKAKEFADFLAKEMAPESARVKALQSGIDDAAAAFYAERFSTEELTAIAAFQKSAAGRKFQELTPHLAALVGPRLMAFQKQLIADLQVATNQPQWPAPKAADAPK